MPERYVVIAAVKTEDGMVHVGRRHSDCFALIGRLGNYVGYHLNSTQGFVDNRWTFLTRSQAYKVAKAAGQLLAPPSGERGVLYSEDIY